MRGDSCKYSHNASIGGVTSGSVAVVGPGGGNGDDGAGGGGGGSGGGGGISDEREGKEKRKRNRGGGGKGGGKGGKAGGGSDMERGGGGGGIGSAAIPMTMRQQSQKRRARRRHRRKQQMARVGDASDGDDSEDDGGNLSAAGGSVSGDDIGGSRRNSVVTPRAVTRTLNATDESFGGQVGGGGVGRRDSTSQHESAQEKEKEKESVDEKSSGGGGKKDKEKKDKEKKTGPKTKMQEMEDKKAAKEKERDEIYKRRYKDLDDYENEIQFKDSMTSWSSRCLRWLEAPATTLRKVYRLMKKLEVQIDHKAGFDDAYANRGDDDDDGGGSGGGGLSPKKPTGDAGNMSSFSLEEMLELDVAETKWNTYAGSHMCSEGEPLFLLRQRWKTLIRSFYNEETNEFDPTKIPDVYDAILYDVLHNNDFLSNLRPLYIAVKQVAEFVIPQEYGVLRKHKLEIGHRVVDELVNRLVADLDKGMEMAPDARCSLYFSSESHIHALRNLFLLSNLPANRTMSAQLEAIELNYMSHGVLRLFEDPSKPLYHPLRLYVNVAFSPGAALDPFIYKDRTDHVLPVSRPVSINGRLPFSEFKHMFLHTPTPHPSAAPSAAEGGDVGSPLQLPRPHKKSMEALFTTLPAAVAAAATIGGNGADEDTSWTVMGEDLAVVAANIASDDDIEQP
jgi:hypothetical protein